ncbi:MAG: pseudouridine synthase [Lachnospiraceae bacterium]|nr:pseudouridine synthase [Lachnospiraceae bacterium]
MSERLNKYIASVGICSRRAADNLILEGKVLINGTTAKPGAYINETDIITVNGQTVKRNRPAKVVLAFYKPVGVTCTEKDRHAEKMIKDVLNYPHRLTYAGRLDKNSEGLLLMTNDGELIDKMMRGGNAHEKEYIVKVNKEINNDFLEKLRNGIYLTELKLTTRSCKARAIGKYTFSIILTQGVNRQIRRMCEMCGYKVKNLKRVRVINIQLAELKPGEYREVNDAELEALYRSCGMNYIPSTYVNHKI